MTHLINNLHKYLWAFAIFFFVVGVLSFFQGDYTIGAYQISLAMWARLAAKLWDMVREGGTL